MKDLFLAFLVVLASQGVSAEPLAYHQLAIKDLDEMVVLVKEKIQDARKDGGADMEPLKEGIRLVFSRPDSDGMIEKVVGPLRSEVEESGDWDATLAGLVDESIAVLKDPEGVKGDMQITHILFLQNVIASMKPKAKTPGAARSMIERIRDAKLELSKEARQERELRTMKATASPSEMADKVLGKDDKK